MDENTKRYTREFFSMTTSITIHLMLLFFSSTKIFSNEISSAELNFLDKGSDKNGNTIENTFDYNSSDYDDDLVIDFESFKNPKAPIKSTKRVISKNNNIRVNRENSDIIDQRSIYKKGYFQGKGTGNGSKAATLDITGWTWDSKPVINDSSNEIGKITFEITIDDMGYVIGIKTIEKTVSSYVERIYRDAVLKLTFKKTDNVQSQEETIGKITFLIQYSE